MANPYDTGLEKTPANYQPLTPLVFLERAAQVHPVHAAIIHGSEHTSYATFYARTRKLASALVARGIGDGDTVSVMLANTPAMLEAHYGVPMTGAVLHSINTRLDARAVAFMLDHADTKVLIGDTEFGSVLKQALKLARVKPLLIDYRDLQCGVEGTRLGNLDYEDFIADGDPDYPWWMPSDEWNAIALNYTSGTTGNPKGVVYHHRGAALMCYCQHHRHRHGPAPGLSVDAADVPLQRLVLPLVDQPRLRHACLPPLGPRQADVRRDRQSRGDASLRRALRHVGAAQRGRRRAAPLRPARRFQPRGSARHPPPCLPRWTRPGSSSPIFTG